MTVASDPLIPVLHKHIWYTTTNRGGKKPFIICKCTAHLLDSEDHAAHLAKAIRAFLKVNG